MKTHTKVSQSALTPAACLDILKKGNQRFQSNLKANRNLVEQVNTTAEGQFPFAAILSCIDSRTSAELIFDQGLGDIFSIRIAGNVLNDDILGSMEFSCKIAGAKLIVILGHTSCGAISGAVDGVTLGYLTGLLQKVTPAVQLAQEDGDLDRTELIRRVSQNNVLQVAQEIRRKSHCLDTMIQEEKVGIVGAMYCVNTGTVEFYTLQTGK